MITKELEIKRSKIATKDQEIKRLIKTLNYSNEVKENILETLKENPMDFSLREEILKVFRKK